MCLVFLINAGIVLLPASGACKYHNFLNSGVNPINNYIFGILMSRAIDWYIIESILRGSKGGGGPGGVGELWGVSPEFY